MSWCPCVLESQSLSLLEGFFYKYSFKLMDSNIFNFIFLMIRFSNLKPMRIGSSWVLSSFGMILVIPKSILLICCAKASLECFLEWDISPKCPCAFNKKMVLRDHNLKAKIFIAIELVVELFYGRGFFLIIFILISDQFVKF